jgi:hypothetical protein
MAGVTYIWKRGGVVIPGSTNTITVTGTDVTVGGSYNYTVSVQPTSGCASNESTPVTLKVSPKPTTPTITANSTTTLLCGTSTQTLNASSGGSVYTWKRESTTLSNTSGSLTVTGNDATGTFLFTVSSTNSVGCVSDYSTGVSLTLAPTPVTPTITTPTIATPICGIASQILTASTGGTSYIWKRTGTILTGSTNTITVTGTDVTVPNTYNYTVATQNTAGCVSAESTSFTLKVSPKTTTPTISPAIFSPNLVCGTDAKTLTGLINGVGFTTGNTYTWKRNRTDFTTSNVANTLLVKGTDAETSAGGVNRFNIYYTNIVGCVSDTAASPVTLQLFPIVPAKPTISANGSTTFCEGNTVAILSSYTANKNVWNRSTGDTTTVGTDAIVVRSTNTYTVKALDANGCFSVVSNPLTVTVNLKPSAPIIDLSGARGVCDLDSIVLTSNNKGSGVYSWSNGKKSRSITVKDAGTYTLTYTDTQIPACTSVPSESSVIIINPLPAKPTITSPDVNKPPVTEFCYRQFTTVEIIKVSVKSVSAFPNNPKGCKSKDASDVVTITVNPLPTTPTITTSGPVTFCPDSTVTLTSSDSPVGVYKWINAKDNLEFSNKKTVLIDTTSKNFNSLSLGKAGRFYVQTISDKNCVSDTSKNVIVTVREAPLAASIRANPITASVCKGDSVTLKTLVANGNIAKYTWRDESNQKEFATKPEVSINVSGSFSVKVRDVYGCFAPYSKPLKVTINPLPTKPSISVVNSKIFCLDDSTTVKSSSPSTTPNGTKNSYRWIVDGTTIIESMSSTFSWKKASSIAVAVTDTNGCKATAISDTIKTTVNPLPDSPTITVRGAIPFCEGKSVLLSAIGTNNVTFKWSTGATTPNATIYTAGNVTVQSINGFGCLSKPSLPINVRVNKLPITPIVTANGSTAFCDGSRVRLVSSSPLSAFWFRSLKNTVDSLGGGDDFNSIFASKVGHYFAKVQDENGCISLSSVPLSVDVRANPTPTIIVQAGTFSLDAQGVGDAEGYIWRYNGDLQADLKTRIIKAKKDGDYQVQASITYTDVPLAGGKLVCYSKASDVLKYVRDLSFDGMSVFPNPSVDGIINVEVIEDLIGANITIYDLYGRLIFDYKVDKFTTIKKIQLPDYHGDTFIVRVTTDGFEKTRKVITLR